MGLLLPDRYKFNHNYCFFLHDFLVDIIKYGEENNRFTVSIKFEDKKSSKKIKELKGEGLWDWLKEKGFEDEIDELTYKQIYVAVLSDFCQFLYTALKCSEKGKLSVTYSLLRKPLKDHLLIFEWLITNPNDFLTKFNSAGSFESIAIDKVTKGEKIKMINKTQDIIPHSFFTPDFIYDIRYNKKVEYGFEKLFQKATHIVTSYKNIRTEKGNLNFIFSDEKAKISQWDHLYFLLPGILLYSVEICMTLYFGIISKDEKINHSYLNRAIIGFLISQQTSNNSYNIKFSKHYFNNFKDLSLKCESCNAEIKLTKQIIKKIIKDFIVPCRCGNTIYFFDKDNISQII